MGHIGHPQVPLLVMETFMVILLDLVMARPTQSTLVMHIFCVRLGLSNFVKN